MMHSAKNLFIGVNHGYSNPSAAIVSAGELLAHAEEERFIRQKHAPNRYPLHALNFCLERVGATIDDVTALGVNWDLKAYTDGSIASYYDRMAQIWDIDETTIAWQRSTLSKYEMDSYQEFHRYYWRREYGLTADIPVVTSFPHHYVHAAQAFFFSGFKDALTITIDGSGDTHCTVLWECRDETITPLLTIEMPHSLGWFYAAITEYLGFQVYREEYKVMGLAAYGRPLPAIQEKIGRILHLADDGIGYLLDPSFIHYGSHSWSDRFTDKLVEFFGRPRRAHSEPIAQWHKDVAFAAQEAVEAAICRLVSWGTRHLNTTHVCISGGVARNVKLNGAILRLEQVTDLFADPLCDDSGAAAGAALLACREHTGFRPKPLRTVALGPALDNSEIGETLISTGSIFTEHDCIEEVAARELAKGRIVGWFQGRLEAGPRALGQRSILANPQCERVRDIINQDIKFRETWRPFCPALPIEYAEYYLKKCVRSPFMSIAFDATEQLRSDAPAIVHVDGTVRAQLVEKEIAPQFHELLSRFKTKTGVPVLLNTSLNLSGMPIDRTLGHALQTFYSSSLDVLFCGNFAVWKPNV